MKRWLTVTVCVVLLLSLTACSLGDSIGDVDFYRGMHRLKQGHYQEAYAYLQSSSSPLAAQELEKFLFVPLTHTVIDDGQRMETAYTYDENGLPRTVTTDHDDTLGGGTICVQEYGYVGLQKRSYRMYNHHNYGTEETVQTYDEWGNLTYDYYRSAHGEVSETFSTYDHRGNPLSEYSDAWNGESVYRMTSTYDDEGRLLTYSHNRNDIFTAEGYRVYNADGSFVEHERYTEPENEGRRQTHYDTEGRVVRATTTPAGINTADYPHGFLVTEHQYDAAGNEVYRYQMIGNDLQITTMEYNERNQLVCLRTVDEKGGVRETEKYTYDEEGRMLSSAISDGGWAWWEVDYTYDEAGHLLTEERSGDVSTAITHTYNEDGTCKMTEIKTSSGTRLLTYGYDAWGNRMQALTQEGRAESHYTATWELHYYPDGIPEEITLWIKNLDWGA